MAEGILCSRVDPSDMPGRSSLQHATDESGWAATSGAVGICKRAAVQGPRPPLMPPPPHLFLCKRKAVLGPRPPLTTPPPHLLQGSGANALSTQPTPLPSPPQDDTSFPPAGCRLWKDTPGRRLRLLKLSGTTQGHKRKGAEDVSAPRVAGLGQGRRLRVISVPWRKLTQCPRPL